MSTGERGRKRTRVPAAAAGSLVQETEMQIDNRKGLKASKHKKGSERRQEEKLTSKGKRRRTRGTSDITECSFTREDSEIKDVGLEKRDTSSPFSHLLRKRRECNSKDPATAKTNRLDFLLPVARRCQQKKPRKEREYTRKSSEDPTTDEIKIRDRRPLRYGGGLKRREFIGEYSKDPATEDAESLDFLPHVEMPNINPIPKAPPPSEEPV